MLTADTETTWRKWLRELRPHAIWESIRYLVPLAGSAIVTTLYALWQKHRKADVDWYLFGGLFVASLLVFVSGIVAMLKVEGKRMQGGESKIRRTSVSSAPVPSQNAATTGPPPPTIPDEDVDKQLRQQKLEQKRRAQLRQLQRFRRLTADAASLSAGCILTVGQYQESPSEPTRRTVAHQVLESICLVVESYGEKSEKPTINANYMLAVLYQSATEEQKADVRYRFDDPSGYTLAHPSRYTHLLVLQQYARPHGAESFALPVEDDRREDWTERTLPGAPEAFLRKIDLVVNTKKLDFGRQVPEDIRDRMSSYLSTKQFQSFASIVIPGPGRPRGIVNVEFDREDFFEGPQAERDLAKILQPFCSALSLILC